MKEIIGTVVKVFGLYYTVKWKEEYINCVLRGKIRQNKELKKYSDPVVVGDIVNFSINDDYKGVINKIETRRNIFSRKDIGKNKKEDIIASNLDLIAVIQSFKNPKLNLRFVDRLLVRGEKEKISVLLCVNKMDITETGQINYVKNYYKNSNINLYMTSALTGKGINTLKKNLHNKISLFVGHSGVGKTSILNYLYPGLNLRTSEISEKTNKGRHTTSNVEMISLTENTGIIDTPGVREFGLMDIKPHTLGQYFSDFNEYTDKCAFNPCSHDHEPRCEVKRQVANGMINKDRYTSYLNILYSLKEYYERQYE